MKAITLMQPQAQLVILGEIRELVLPWEFPFELAGEEIAIHTSNHFAQWALDMLQTPRVAAALARHGLGNRSQLALSAVIGSVPVEGCEFAWNNAKKHCRMYRWKFGLSTRIYTPPICATGQPGVWDWKERS